MTIWIHIDMKINYHLAKVKTIIKTKHIRKHRIFGRTNRDVFNLIYEVHVFVNLVAIVHISIVNILKSIDPTQTNYISVCV